MIKYIAEETTTLFRKDEPDKAFIQLLWGDRVEVLSNRAREGKVLVKARGCTGYVTKAHLGDEPLLEIYFIDVGQGDGILIVTPDRKHVLIDGGYSRKSQPHNKSAADFVDWKFFKDYGSDTIILDAMIASHNDADHYGGLWDLINPKLKNGLDTKHIEVGSFFHAGVSWWKGKGKKRWLGEKKNGYLVDILEDENSIIEALNSNEFSLQGEWADFLQCIIDIQCTVKRLGYDPDYEFEYVPGFSPGENDVSLKVLGPIAKTSNHKTLIRDLGADSQNTNGNSILLRLDYGNTRVLLTGDLNKKSQQELLEVFKGRRQELAADIMKACHHGSDDCSFEFLESVQPSATIISSGDDETHAHPRPNIVAASAVTGFRKIVKDEMVTPLIYSTEISRSMKLGDPLRVDINGAFYNEEEVQVHFETRSSGALKPTKKSKKLSQMRVVDGIVYGLVNVRTDGNNIICATLNEGKHKWEIKRFISRF